MGGMSPMTALSEKGAEPDRSASATHARHEDTLPAIRIEREEVRLLLERDAVEGPHLGALTLCGTQYEYHREEGQYRTAFGFSHLNPPADMIPSNSYGLQWRAPLADGYGR